MDGIFENILSESVVSTAKGKNEKEYNNINRSCLLTHYAWNSILH